jgi:hypothetical protein
MENQDWSPVTIRSQNPAVVSRTAPRQIQERNPGRSLGSHLAKVEREEYIKPKMLSSESRQALIATRAGLKKTQAELDRMCAFPPHTIREIEANRACPTTGQLNRLNKELKLSLKLE